MLLTIEGGYITFKGGRAEYPLSIAEILGFLEMPNNNFDVV